MLNDKQKAILRHRWLVFGIIAAIIITFLHLWEFLLYIAGGLLIIYLMIEGIGWLINWLSGNDMRDPSRGRGQVSDDFDEDDHDSVSDTLWDIETLHALQHHNDDYAHYHDYLNDDDDNDDPDDDDDLY